MSADVDALPRAGTFRPSRSIVVNAIIGVCFLLAVTAFMTYDLKGSLSFALELRAKKVVAMTLVGVGLSVATVLFHTVSGNRILTPALMGFDALYILIQTVAAYLFGTFAFLRIDVRIRFVGELAVMMGFALLLNHVFLRRTRGDVVLLMLAGVVMSGMFRALSNLVARLIDPNEFVALQDRLFASFSSVDEQLLLASTVCVALALVVVWRMRYRLDAVALGHEHATSLGVDVDRTTKVAMALVAVLVAVPTALVGAITFLGLLTSNAVYLATRTFRHRYTIPASAIAGATVLIGAQFVIEEFFEFNTRASMVIAFFGGIAFIVLLLKEQRR
ncbi:MAG: iron chelate uptake ABC transporter family permease subunit [Ilumatobacter sp.]|nr:iron chelate uptake ABC transporter family permease subunit [Ilumatobacter sp.]